ncbi:hypothetical protein [Arthrobacter sp. VKM Ac-2550]|uniref:amino acid kinase family protein n=1 Tax=Crystallibacter permensis TaxID=1938888 RepID=UPI002226260E|nr:hypothetical protein [Arthrobacter sp. VKM Ac-2550]MCW2132693.1 Amino acid kinase family protein [Arthrobacter sp. VKM Ac-2550]
MERQPAHGKAYIVGYGPLRLRTVLNRGEIPLVAGFHGKGLKSKETTTWGPGGSDLTAIVLAAALGASVCEIYTDVDGVYSAGLRYENSTASIRWNRFRKFRARPPRSSPPSLPLAPAPTWLPRVSWPYRLHGYVPGAAGGRGDGSVQSPPKQQDRP